MSEVRQFTVTAEDDGIRLDRWCKRHLEDTSFTTVAKWARTGQLRVDGARATPGDRLLAGQVLRLPPAEPVRADAPPMRPTPLTQDGLLNLFSGDVVGRNVVLEPATRFDMLGKETVEKKTLEVVYDTV